MITFLFKKIIKHKWITLCLLLGNIFLAGVVSSIPLYAQAATQKLLMRQTNDYLAQKGEYPGFVEWSAALGSGPASVKLGAEDGKALAFSGIPERFGLPALTKREILTVSNIGFLPEEPLSDEPETLNCDIYSVSLIRDYSKMVLGVMFRDRPRLDGVIEAVVGQGTYDSLNIILGGVYESSQFVYNGQPLRIKVTGVFDAAEDSGYYWNPTPSSYQNVFFIGDTAFAEVFMENEFPAWSGVNAAWQVNLDCAALDVTATDNYLSAAKFYADMDKKSADAGFRESFSSILSGYNEKSDKLNITLWVLQTPMFFMLLFFIFIVSKQILRLDKGDIDVLKSRGASGGQILRMYLSQGFLVGVVSMALGLPLGWFICRVTGASSGFLSLVDRSALPVRYNDRAFLYAGAALVLSIITMALPAWRYSRISIAETKRERRKKWGVLPVIMEVLILLASAYGFYRFNIQNDIIAETARQAVDPLMYLTASLFIVGAGLLCLRLFPPLAGLIFKIFKNILPPSAYVSFLRVIRTAGDERFIMIFLVFTVAFGIFGARLARTVNRNAEDSVLYEVGADVRLKEVWRDNAEAGGGDQVLYHEPDFNRFAELPGVKSAAKVYTAKAEITGPGGNLTDSAVMAIQTDQFGRIAYYRDDFFPTHFYNYLNTMSRDAKGVIASANLKEYYKIGDIVNYRVDSENCSGVIYGFADYWPGYKPVERTENADGGYSDKPQYLIAANLHYVQSVIGLRPYEIWLKTDADSNNFITRYALDNNIKFASFTDARAQIITGRNEPVLQGTNGALTIDFIINLTVCAVGFLIYWILSIKDRALQFGVFRAMGMHVRGIVSILCCEQALVSLMAVLIGSGVGVLASRLFTPMIQLAYSASEQPIPIILADQPSDYARLFGAIGITILVCLIALGAIVSRIRIASALKLGEE
ncbi:MAG: ABC transporter permease [Clostridiales bacterium]|jgi:putative ABC transport system permease protein|nr:ABC transporter permease [Clostridiales bacterium]